MPRNSKRLALRAAATPITAISPSDTAVPEEPAEHGVGSASSTKGTITRRGLAPSAIFTPISRVRSLTTAYMMFATPIPPIMSVSAPMIPRNSWMPSAMLSMMRCVLARVPDRRARGVSSGSKWYLARQHAVDSAAFASSPSSRLTGR